MKLVVDSIYVQPSTVIMSAETRSRTKYQVLLLLCFLAFNAPAQNTAISLYETIQVGEATYYDNTGSGGNCTISSTLPAWGNDVDFEAALSPTLYASGDQSGGCGTCFVGTYLGTGSGLTPPPAVFTGLVVDQCLGCSTEDLDLAMPSGDGRWDIDWQAIDCPVGNTKLAYLLQGSNSFYIKVGVRNHRIAVEAVQIQSTSSSPYITLNRTSDNFFTCSGCDTPMEYPIPIRILGVNNQVIEDFIPALVNDVLQTGLENEQFLSIDDIIFIDDFDDLGF